MPLNPQSYVPTVGQVVTCPDSVLGTITNVVRNNSYGKWCCAIHRADGRNDYLDVFYDGDTSTWKTEMYLVTRYPDEDGVNKEM